MVEIRCLDISKIHQDEYERLYYFCDDERKNKIKRYVHNDDRKCGAVAHILMKYVCIESGRNIAKLTVLYNAYEKPYIQNDGSFYFNLSHTGKWVAIAYADSVVGIDIEQVQKTGAVLWNSFFGGKEKIYIQNAGSKKESDRRFIQIWTIKESYLFIVNYFIMNIICQSVK